MLNKAVFLDRDGTLIDDPGYLADPQGVRLLPGVEQALKALRQAGYKLVVVTNQSGVARGLLTLDTLESIHSEMRRLLGAHGVHLDGIYYCPYHPEGTVDGFVLDSDLRKPKPGMLLQAAQELDLDLSASWMVGDGARDVEAGQRAGCRTIRLRHSETASGEGNGDDEGVQADFTVRNMAEASRIILRHVDRPVERALASVAAAEEAPGAGQAQAVPAGVDEAAVEAVSPEATGEPARAQSAPPVADVPAAPVTAAVAALLEQDDHDARFRAEILDLLGRIVGPRGQPESFQWTKFLAGLSQGLAVLALVLTLLRLGWDQPGLAVPWALVAVTLQTMALTFFMMQRNR